MYVAESFYLAVLALAKISILCFYLRIFPNPRFRLLTRVVMGWVGLSGVASLLCQVLQCVPVAFVWEGWKKGEFGPHACLDLEALTYASAGSNIAQEVAILCMPLPIVARLRIPLRARLGAAVMFSLGVFVLATSCARLWTIYSFGDSPNPTWDSVDIMVWSGVEASISIMVPNLPAIRVVAGRLASSAPARWMSDWRRRRRQRRGSGEAGYAKRPLARADTLRGGGEPSFEMSPDSATFPAVRPAEMGP